MVFGKSKSKIKHRWGDDRPETLSETPQMAGAMAKDLAKLVNPADFITQLLGIEGPSSSGDHGEVNISSHSEVLFARPTHLEGHKTRETAELEQQTTHILSELKKQVTMLEKSEKKLTAQISKITVENVPTKQGIYYIRFFEWLITMVRQLRRKIEEGTTWLTEFNARSKKKKGYWQMVKKHGTSFGMSNERAVASSVG